MAHIKKNVKKRGFRGIGIFLFGMFFGLIFTLGTLFGVGFWAYNNLSIKKVEKITKKEISISNKELKSLTLSDVVKNVSNIVSSLDTYTLGQLEKDFNLSLFNENGMLSSTPFDFSSLKSSTKNTLKNDINQVITNATLDSFIEYLNKTDEQLGIFASILNTNINYYFDGENQKLCLEQAYANEVKFNYSIVDEDTIKINGEEKDLISNKLTLKFREVPIKQAFSDFDAVTNSLTLGEILNEDYESSPAIIKSLYNVTISNLHTKIGELKLYEALGWTKIDNTYTDSSNNQITNKVLLALAENNINNIDEGIEGLLAKDIFEESDPILALFSSEELNTLTVTQLPTQLVTKINNATIYELASAGIINMNPEDVPVLVKDKTIIYVISTFNI